MAEPRTSHRWGLPHPHDTGLPRFTSPHYSPAPGLTWIFTDGRAPCVLRMRGMAKAAVCMNEVLTATLKEVRIHELADDLVFCSHKGTPYRSFCSAFEQAVRKAGLEDFHVMFTIDRARDAVVLP